jgi:hypothetical protein
MFITAVSVTKLFAWGEGEWRTCATRDDEPRPVGTREELGTLTQGAPIFPGSSCYASKSALFRPCDTGQQQKKEERTGREERKKEKKGKKGREEEKRGKRRRRG